MAAFYMAAFSQTDLAQSFMQAGNYISGAAVMTQAGIGGGDTITMAIWTQLPNAGGSMIASGSVAGTAPGQWAEVHWSPVPITPNTTYYMVFTSEHEHDGSGWLPQQPVSAWPGLREPGLSAVPEFRLRVQDLLSRAGVLAAARSGRPC